jgi:hypothetical protein
MNLRIRIICAALFFCLLIPYVTEAGVVIVGSLTREREAAVGESYQGVIFVRNPIEEPAEVKIYQTDYLFFSDGTSIYGEPGKIGRSNAKWISFSPHRLVIPPEDKSAVEYTVKVPDDETLVGTYWSMLMVEEISKSSPEASEPEKGRVELGVRQVMRYGIQMLTHIGDTGTRKIKFLDKKLIIQDGKTILQMDIENIGERWLTPTVWVELYNNQGGEAGRLESGKRRIYPSCSVRYKVDLTDVPKGKYKALVVADNGDEYVFGAKYDLGIE